jgi:tetratricopeptide (TPR) repeat protein
MKASHVAFGLVCALVVALFFVSAGLGGSEWGHAEPGSLYYQSLARGFSAGQLSLKKEAPPGLARLSDPYDPAANAPYLYAPYQLNDLSYFQGRFYLYFGVTPALLLFWPWLLLTGQDLPHKYAAAAGCSVGFLAAAWLLRGLWRRYFPDVAGWVAVLGALALGLATSATVMLQRPGVSEVPIGCAYALVSLSLAAIWRALHAPGREGRWLAAASLAYGLALGARPSELPGAVILLVPVFALVALRRTGASQPTGSAGWRWLAAAVIPIACCGAGLLLYNHLRFGDSLEFGQRYQLAAERQSTVRHFSLGYLGYNLRLYFFAPTSWSRFFPFIQGTVVPPLPPGHARPENVISVLPNLPLAALALLAPLAWRQRSREEAGPLRAFLAAVGLLFALFLLPLLLYYWTSNRYEVEFLPPLILLAMAGIFGIERALADRGPWLGLARAGWIALLVFSIGFSLLASLGRYAAECQAEGSFLLQSGKWAEAADKFQAALRVNSRMAEAEAGWGDTLLALGRPGAAAAHYGEAVQLAPDSALAHFKLASSLDGAGQLDGALAEYAASLRLDPGQAETHNQLGVALARSRRLPEAAAEFAAAVRLKPDFAAAHANLGNTFLLLRRLEDAAGQYEAALRLTPGDTELRARLAAVRQALSNPR